MLFSTGNLAVLLCQQGKYAKAEAMHRQALQLLETALGKDHVYTFKSMMVLAVSLHYQTSTQRLMFYTLRYTECFILSLP